MYFASFQCSYILPSFQTKIVIGKKKKKVKLW